MTIRSAERINGCRIEQVPYVGGVAFAAFEDGSAIAMASGRDKRAVLKQLVERVYAVHSAVVLELQGYRCGECGRGGVPLQVHHRRHRSHGRDDRVENLIGLCCTGDGKIGGCHARIHGG